jgi:hypothetical protein
MRKTSNACGMISDTLFYFPWVTKSRYALSSPLGCLTDSLGFLPFGAISHRVDPQLAR